MMHTSSRRHGVRRITFSALLLALAFFLPYLTGQIPEIGRVLSPMHIPAMLAGFVLPLPWAIGVAFLMPILRSLITDVPVLVPIAATMAFELAAYALTISILKRFGRLTWLKVAAILLAAMVVGRVIYIIVFYIVMVAMAGQFSLEATVIALTLEALPGIIAQFLILPPIVMALQKAGYIEA